MFIYTSNPLNYQKFTCQVKAAAHFLVNRVSSVFNKMIQSITHLYYQITMYPRGWAVEFAANNGAFRLINTLLANGPIPKNPRGRSVRSAAEKNNLIMFRSLLTSGPISQEHRGLAITWAALNNNLDMVQSLLANGPISQEYRGIAITLAAKKNNLIMFHALLANGSISQEHRSLAITSAAVHNNLDMVQALLANGLISQEHRGIAVTWASKTDNLDIAHTLLANGPISQEHRGIAIILAAEKNNLSMFQALLESGPILQEHRGRAITSAALHNNLDIVQALLANGPISEEHRDLAINNALANADLEMLVLFNVVAPNPQVPGVPGRLYINRDELKETPALYLSRTGAGFSGVTFVNSDGTRQPGIDAGGLTKQFIHELLDSLVVKNIIKLDEKRFPLCDVSTNEPSYKDLGKLFSVIDQKNIGRTDPIYIGPLFDPKLFDFFKDFLDPTLSEYQRLKKLANHLQLEGMGEIINFLNQDEPTEKQLNEFRRLMEETNFVEEGAYTAKTKEELRKMCEKPFETYTKALSLITSSFSDDLKAKILAQGAGYAEILQGPETIDKEALVAKIQIREDNHLSAAQRLEVLKKRDWIVEKITSTLEVNPRSLWVKKFLFCVTGQPVIPFSKIEIRGIAGGLCIAHTCFNLFDVPFTSLAPHLADKTAEELEALAKARFFERLEEVMSILDYGLT